MTFQPFQAVPEDAVLARVILFAQRPTDALRPLKVYLWPADKGAPGDAVCYLLIEEILPRPIPVQGIDNMHAMEQALLLADTTLAHVGESAQVRYRSGEGPYLSTRRPGIEHEA